MGTTRGIYAALDLQYIFMLTVNIRYFIGYCLSSFCIFLSWRSFTGIQTISPGMSSLWLLVAGNLIGNLQERDLWGGLGEDRTILEWTLKR